MDTQTYFENVALLREIAIQDGATATAEEILKLYDDALGDINTEIQKIKYNFAKRFGLDNKTAAFFLTQAQEEENLKMLVEALENAPDDKAREDILEYIHRDGLSVRAYASRIERYEAVKTSIYARIKKLAVDETAMLGSMLKEAYKESYYGNIDDTAKGFDVGINFGILNDDAINEAVNAKWSGKRFSKRIWDNTDRLAKEAQDLIVKSIMSGESNAKTAQKLADRMQVEKFHATTLVRTETAHVHAMADLKAYEDLGIEQYRYLSTLDHKTCQTCSPLDGQVFYVRDAREGRNYPVLHPRCRCTTSIAMEFDKRRARNPLTGKNELIDGNITYSQWIRDMPQSQRQALELSRRKDSNRTADKLQHEKYKKLLGTKEVPKSFGDFQKMKYAEPDKWKELKRLYRENSVDKNKKSGYNRFRKTNNTGSFKELTELMQKKHVMRIIKEMEIDYKNIEIDIIRDESLIGSGLMGYTFPNGKKVQLYPDAFVDREQLVKTIGHERIHCEQIRLFGEAKNMEEELYYEKGPMFSEEYWWNEYVRRTGYANGS